MLHLKFALNLEHLADEMIEQISSCWSNPFESPLVIFPDSKLEQWFQLRWVKKKGVLANFNKRSIDKFLFDILVGDDKRKKKLSSEMLANVIMADLLGKDGDYGSLDKTGQIAKYLTTADGKLDAGRLYDFANKLAGLFLEYEISRPSQYLLGSDGKMAEGILDCWSQELLRKGEPLKDFFVKKTKKGKFEPVDNEPWERALYSSIFHNADGANGKSLLTRVFEEADSEPDPEKKVKYLTLPFLYKDCLDASGSPTFHYKSKAPVFILGLSGMGQFYRVVLREFAKQHDVFAYIQNPCMEFWEDLETLKVGTSKIAPKISTTLENDKIAESEDFASAYENKLLRDWGKAGRDNIKLWCLADDYTTCEFPEGEQEKLLNEDVESPKSLLNAVQNLVANRRNKFEDSLFKKSADDNSITVMAAPSKLREVEALHSSICKLLLEGVSVRDILVMSPNLQEYVPYIYQIFDQAKIAAENGDKSIVHIPYTVVDSVSKESLVGSLIKTLFRIRSNKAVSRPDFFSLVRNPVVQAARGINSDIVSIWEHWITEMNVYRDRPGKELGSEPWLWGAKRMLLARLTSEVQTIEGCVYTPYADINSSNDSILLKFVEVVEDLEKWTNAFEDGLHKDDVEMLLEMLNGWAKMKNSAEELMSERAAYGEVCKAIYCLRYFYFAGANSIPLEIVKECLVQASAVLEYSFGNLFVNGVTFMKFAPNRIIPVKHLFFLGADADHFPKDDSFDTLDLRRLVRPWPGDDSSISRNRYAFLCQLMCTSEGVHISYQNINLAKDSEIYPSPIINDLKNFIAGFAEPLKDENGRELDALPTEEIPLDETRANENIFTRRGRRYRESIACMKNLADSSLNNEDVISDSAEKTAETQYPDKVSVSQLKSYLNDPFQFYVNRILHLENVDEDPTEEAVEPISLNKLDESAFLKDAIHIERGLHKDYKDVKTYFAGLQNQGNIPFGRFGDGVVDKIKERANAINNEIEQLFSANEYDCKSMELNECITLDVNKSFILQGNVPFVFVSKADEKKCVIVEICNSKSIGIYRFLSSYIVALGLLASQKMAEIDLCVSNGDSEKNPDEKICHLNVSASAAKEKLVTIYKNAFVECKKNILPIDLVVKSLESFDDLHSALDDGFGHGAWAYFGGKDLFIGDLERYSGYSANSFSKDWTKACEKQIKLVEDLADKFKARA
ncbi:exodeoxyribonuclease V subunit gamma [Fibrobacter sp.]|uniref:exodeoxyribonuclease V subunit gamma n=1 Tax=Fibrobacter sp. TaxID=35828 RepID=UPI0025C684A7|nr:exodeoxyribonuclease V subunit gamma [Fibrobacter sp.]MBR3071324.1 exodeoxyribonuclease V subunit gamma [Fibrobacter sp.]